MYTAIAGIANAREAAEEEDTENAAPVRDTEKKFDPLEFHDEYRQRLMDKIEAKVEGKPVVSPQREKRKAS